MYCPRCGQQQFSEEIRFCSRCGLPLNLVAEVLSHGGTLPQLAEIYKQKGFFNRSNGIKLGLVWFLLMTFLVTPILAIAGGEEVVAITAVLGFFGGILIMLFSIFFLKNDSKMPNAFANQNANESANYLGGNQGNNRLPPQQTMPASTYAAPAPGAWQSNTDDLQPTSVTEETTKLLKKEK